MDRWSLYSIFLSQCVTKGVLSQMLSSREAGWGGALFKDYTGAALYNENSNLENNVTKRFSSSRHFLSNTRSS